ARAAATGLWPPRPAAQSHRRMASTTNRRHVAVIDFDTYHQVRRLGRELNLTAAQIAAQTGLNIKTVRKWLDRPRYEPRRKGPRRSSKLDPYKDLIVSWLEKHPFSGMQI